MSLNNEPSKNSTIKTEAWFAEELNQLNENSGTKRKAFNS